VEHSLREDVQKYEDAGITPYEVGTRILQHPAMQVTSPLKRRSAQEMQITQSYSGQLVQMFKFPFDNPAVIAEQADSNLAAVKKFFNAIGKPEWDDNGPIWSKVPANTLVNFLKEVRAELAKVSWPTREQMISFTLAVLGVSLFFAIYLGLWDLGLAAVLNKFILK
jgi:preprotein translocase SecE subunit